MSCSGAKHGGRYYLSLSFFLSVFINLNTYNSEMHECTVHGNVTTAKA